MSVQAYWNILGYMGVDHIEIFWNLCVYNLIKILWDLWVYKLIEMFWDLWVYNLTEMLGNGFILSRKFMCLLFLYFNEQQSHVFIF